MPLPQAVAEALARHLEAFPAASDGLIFTNKHGAPINRSRFSDVWRQAVRDGAPSRPVRFHDLRHFYASLLIRHGESVKVVQARLGHASASETLDTYSHLWPDSEDTTRDAVDSVLQAHAVAETDAQSRTIGQGWVR
ncbi:MAG TPA: tyrosine-type recombinase/integrase [Acidimicrobiia bacterium]|nr:tyrosine-type recombinase/integrase [Acidimicrobiia bacterium]